MAPEKGLLVGWRGAKMDTGTTFAVTTTCSLLCLLVVDVGPRCFCFLLFGDVCMYQVVFLDRCFMEALLGRRELRLRP